MATWFAVLLLSRDPSTDCITGLGTYRNISGSDMLIDFRQGESSWIELKSELDYQHGVG